MQKPDLSHPIRIAAPRGCNLAARALAGAACRQRIVPSGKLYRRADKHPGRALAEWSW